MNHRLLNRRGLAAVADANNPARSGQHQGMEFTIRTRLLSRPTFCILMFVLECACLRAADTAAQSGAGAEPMPAVSNAIRYLCGVAAADPDGWFAPPVRQRTVVGQKEVKVYMKKVEVDVAVWEYETRKEYKNVKQGASVDAVVVRKEVEVRRPIRQIGTTKETRLVRDPKGDIEVTQKVPEYGPGGPDLWKAYHFGHNAMAIYALLSAGIGPDDERINRPLENLASLFDNYGVPDTTWDLAWVAAAFSIAGKNNDRYKAIAVLAASKLIDGQIDSGPAAGLWGPVCLNLKLVAAIEGARSKLASDFSLAQADVDAKKKNAEVRLEATKVSLQSLDREIRDIMMCRSFDYRTTEILQKLANEVALAINVTGLPQYPYNQVAADMENTSMALFGLAVASENGTLPAETVRPKVGNLRLPAGLRAAQVLLRTTSALARAQGPDGSFNELNIHQPHGEFAASAKVIPGIPAKAGSFVPLDSKITFTSSAQGYASLLYLRRILGALVPLARNIAAAETCLNGRLDELTPAGFAGEDGGQVAPYDALFALHLAHSLSPGSLAPKTWAQTVAFIEDNQEDDGAWVQQGSFYTRKRTGSKERQKGDTRNPADAVGTKGIIASGSDVAVTNAPRPNDWMIFSSQRERANKTMAILSELAGTAPPTKAPPTNARKTPAAKKADVPPQNANPRRRLMDFDFSLAHVYADLEGKESRDWYHYNYSYNSEVVATCFALASLLHPNTTAMPALPASGRGNPALPAPESSHPVAHDGSGAQPVARPPVTLNQSAGGLR